MKIGICTRYTSHEAAFAALRLADAAEEMGLDVEILTMTEEPAKLCPKWDARVLRTLFVPFSRWSSYCDHVIWTTIPHPQQIEWVKKAGIHTSIFVLWCEIERFHGRSMALADTLLCPSNACYSLLHTNGFKNAKYIPWDCGTPLHKKPADHKPTNPKVLLPLWDGNPRKCELTVASLVDQCLWQNKDAEFTLVCNSSTLNPQAMKSFKLLQKQYARVTIVKKLPPQMRFKYFQSHDLTLCPFHYDNFGMTALQSIEMGTPVVGFGISPCTEFLHLSNSVLVPCQIEFNDMRVPKVIPDYLMLEHALVKLLADPARIKLLQQTTSKNIMFRRGAFDKVLRSILL